MTDRNIVSVFFVALVGLGCVSQFAGAPPRGESPLSDYRVIASSELQSISAAHLYDAIERLRPRWLRRDTPRSVNIPTEIAVVLDGQYLGDTESLRGVSPLRISRIELLDGPAAAAVIPRLSTGRHVEGAIVVSSIR